MRAQPGIEVVHQDDVRRIVETLPLGKDAGLDEHRFDRLVAVFGQVDLLRLLVDRVVAGAILLELALEPGNHLVDADIQLGVLARRPGDDQRGTGLVDKDRVDLVDDRERELALHLVRVAERHVVAQVVEPELVVRRVDDIRGVGVALVLRVHSRDDDTGPHAQKLVDRPHPLCVALREVVVHRDDVHAAPGERVQIGREGGDERLALPRAHLGDLALVERDAAEQLDIEVAHFEGAAARLAHDRERLGEDGFERLSLADPRSKRVGARAKRLVGERDERRLQRIDALDGLLHPAQLPIVSSADDLAEKPLDHRAPDRRRDDFAMRGISIQSP